MEQGEARMGTSRTRRLETDDEPTHNDDRRNALAATDWRRMTAAAHDKIAHRAHQLYEARGREPGHEMEDWLQAEHDIEEHDARPFTVTASDRRSDLGARERDADAGATDIAEAAPRGLKVP
jgi:hypothetical protein